ncbi:MAG: RNA 2',3'-cyclic phosphodiesterase [Acidimicrobiia bacterium]|nr:RNA 2',3'-cyclic phosphodiesterase [Acidimicrobiia bacterium]MDH5616867.1 RNA 2',3'-cyclic phosphodiesterase [Acidimicrobiia bacterium]
MANVGRLFVAVALTDEVRAALAAHVMGAMKDRPLPGKPVPPPNWHLTLRFLGPCDDAAYDRLLAGLAEAELGGPFAITFGGLGAFPRPARATVLWLAIDGGAGRLEQLAARSEDAAQQAGFAPEDRPFHSHLTLSRIRPHQDLRPLIEQVDSFPMSLPVDRLIVYRSHLGRGGARYEELESFELST